MSGFAYRDRDASPIEVVRWGISPSDDPSESTNVPTNCFMVFPTECIALAPFENASHDGVQGPRARVYNPLQSLNTTSPLHPRSSTSTISDGVLGLWIPTLTKVLTPCCPEVCLKWLPPRHFNGPRAIATDDIRGSHHDFARARNPERNYDGARSVCAAGRGRWRRREARGLPGKVGGRN